MAKAYGLGVAGGCKVEETGGMLAKVCSCAVLGLDGALVEVEVDIGQGLPAFSIVGLPDAAVNEAKERVRAAIKNSGAVFPLRRITVNLAHADLRKAGPACDLPIAVAIVLASGQVTPPSVTEEARCVDATRMDRIARRFGRGETSLAGRIKLKGNRAECGCYESRDIGEYDTCPHGCIYYYAVRERDLAVRRYREHDPTSEFLFKPKGEVAAMGQPSEGVQGRLF